MIDFDLHRELSILADEAQPADLESRVRRRARTIRTRRTVTAVVGVVVLVAAAVGTYTVVRRAISAPVVPARTCILNPVPKVLTVPAGGSTANFVFIDPTGRYVASGNVLWHDGVPKLIPGGDGATQFTAFAVNASGEAVGTSGVVAAVYRDGRVTKLTGGDPVGPTGINAAGDVVGYVGLIGNFGWSAVVWRAGHPDTPQVLPRLAPDGSTNAWAITDNGTILGDALDGRVTPDANPIQYAYEWLPDGTGRKLAMPPGYQFASVRSASGDWAAGFVGQQTLSGTVPKSQKPAMWDLRTGKVTIPTASSEIDVDSLGELLVPGGEAGGRSYVLSGGKQIPLRPPAGTDMTTNTYMATDMNSDGTVVVGALIDENHVTTPLVWRC